jgi:hypothetical protein
LIARQIVRETTVQSKKGTANKVKRRANEGKENNISNQIERIRVQNEDRANEWMMRLETENRVQNDEIEPFRKEKERRVKSR